MPYKPDYANDFDNSTQKSQINEMGDQGGFMSSPPSTTSKKKRGEENGGGLVYKYPSFSNDDNTVNFPMGDNRQTIS